MPNGSAGTVQTSAGGKGAATSTAYRNTAAGKTASGDMYAGHDGNVYKNTGSGWQKYDNGSWNTVSKPTTASAQSYEQQHTPQVPVEVTPVGSRKHRATTSSIRPVAADTANPAVAPTEIWTRKLRTERAARPRAAISPSTNIPEGGETPDAGAVEVTAGVAAVGAMAVVVLGAKISRRGLCALRFELGERVLRSPMQPRTSSGKGIVMKTRNVFCVFAVCLASSFALAQQVSVNYDHNASFGQYHTYAWGSNNTNQIRNSILAQVAQQDINNAMQGKGLQMVPESQNPDLILTASGGEREQTSWNAWGMRGIGGGMGGISPEQNVEATMIVSLYDAKQQSLIWRGIAQNTLNTNGNKNQEMVQKAVQKMFKQWPKS